VARDWGLDVTAHAQPNVLGSYVPGRRIELGVSNLSTWAHELLHAADDRLGTLDLGKRIDGELVAELGGAVLLEALGLPDDSDRGGAFHYLSDQCAKDGRDLLSACLALVERVHACVQLLLDTAERLTASKPSSAQVTVVPEAMSAQLGLFSPAAPTGAEASMG